MPKDFSPRDMSDADIARLADQRFPPIAISSEEASIAKAFGVRLSQADNVFNNPNPINGLPTGINQENGSVNMVKRGTDLGRKDVRFGTRGRSSTSRNWTEK